MRFWLGPGLDTPLRLLVSDKNTPLFDPATPLWASCHIHPNTTLRKGSLRPLLEGFNTPLQVWAVGGMDSCSQGHPPSGCSLTSTECHRGQCDGKSFIPHAGCWTLPQMS